jgi:hypothetical protein
MQKKIQAKVKLPVIDTSVHIVALPGPDGVSPREVKLGPVQFSTDLEIAGVVAHETVQRIIELLTILVLILAVIYLTLRIGLTLDPSWLGLTTP